MATINDIAKMAKVSAATVSHVVNKTRFVSPVLAKRVEDAINALEIPPNFVIKKSKTNTISTNLNYIVLLASNIHNPFQLEVEKYIKDALKNEGYTLITLDYNGDCAKLDLYFQFAFSPANVQGVIVLCDDDENSIKRHLNLTKVPIVFVGKDIDGINADVILSDNYGGAYKATNHLIHSGHENIGIICGNRYSESNVERINGYQKALEDNNISINSDYIITDLISDDLIYNAMKTLLLSQNPPTAIFAANYSTILSVFKFIEANNIICPNDLSIVGFNDFEWATLHNPPITTVAQDTEKIGYSAAQAIIERLKGTEDSSEIISKIETHFQKKNIVIPTELRVRNSTCGIGRGPFGEKAASADLLQLTDSEKKIISNGNYSATISFHYMGKAWMQLHERGIKDIFNLLDISLLAITDAHFDPVMQSKQLDGLLAFEPDVIIGIPTDNAKTSEAFKKVSNSKAKLVLIANVPDGLTPSDYVTCVTVNERSHGRCVGRGLGEYMKKNKKKNIGLIKHNATFYATNQRDNAAEQILIEEYPELNICGVASFESEEDAYEKTLELMKNHPEIEGLYISWEGPTIKAMSALADLKRSDVAIATADLEYSLALNMAKGGCIKVISAQCPYEQGQAIALAAANALINKKVPSFIGAEPIYVTSENLLKSWKKVYKEEPPAQLIEALKDNPNYMSIV